MIKFHMRKVKPFIQILSNFHEFLSTPTPSAAAVNWSGSEARFEETQDQLLPRHFENTGPNLFSYVECSYLVLRKNIVIREFVDIKNFTVQNIFVLLRCALLWVVFSKASPGSDSWPKRRKSTNPFRYNWNLQHMCWCQHKYIPKIIEFHERLGKKKMCVYCHTL